MIISASRRTDIPALYGEWFLNRIRAGSCLVPNPFNRHQVAEVSLRRADVDAFVFWTRNPTPFLPVLDELERRGYPFYFLFTITGLGPPLEPWCPSTEEAVTAFVRLADRLGSNRVIWRFDPIILPEGASVRGCQERFVGIARSLAGATSQVKISFVDLYRKTTRRLGSIGTEYLADPRQHPQLEELLSRMVTAASDNGMSITTCAEKADYAHLGIGAGRCVDAQLLSRLFGCEGSTAKDAGQRPACACSPSKDIGMCDSCVHGCRYCYATLSHRGALANRARHDPTGPSLLRLK